MGFSLEMEEEEEEDEDTIAEKKLKEQELLMKVSFYQIKIK